MAYQSTYELITADYQDSEEWRLSQWQVIAPIVANTYAGYAAIYDKYNSAYTFRYTFCGILAINLTDYSYSPGQIFDSTYGYTHQSLKLYSSQVSFLVPNLAPILQNPAWSGFSAYLCVRYSNQIKELVGKADGGCLYTT